MPDVPFNPNPTVAPAGAPGVFLNVERNPNAFGASVAQAGQNLGATLDQAGTQTAQTVMKFQQEYNESAVDKANTALEKRNRENVLFGPDGFYNKRGGDAMDAMGPASQQLEQNRLDARASLSNPEQQRMFDYMTRRSASRELYQMQAHATTEFRVWQGDTAKGAIENEVNNSATYWNDDQRFAQSVGAIKIQAAKLLTLKGIDPDSDTGKAEITHYTSEAWSARIRSVMAQNPSVAREMFDANADQMDAGHRAVMDQQLTSHQWTQTMRETAAAQKDEQIAAKQQRDFQTGNEADMMGRAVSGKAPTTGELADALRTQAITPAAYHSIIAVTRGAADAPSDPRLLASMYGRIGDPNNPLTKDEVLAAAGRGLHGGAAASLMQALNASSRREESPVASGLYASLKTALGGHNVEQGIVDLTKEAGRQDAALWAQAQAEWTNRVRVKGEDPQAVFSDMIPRYQQKPAVPAYLPAPRLGAVLSIDDVKARSAETLAAVKSGQMSPADAAAQSQLLGQYEKFYQVQAARNAAALAAKPKAPTAPPASGKSKARGIAAQEQ